VSIEIEEWMMRMAWMMNETWNYFTFLHALFSLTNNRALLFPFIHFGKRAATRSYKATLLLHEHCVSVMMIRYYHYYLRRLSLCSVYVICIAPWKQSRNDFMHAQESKLMVKSK
jgi:hypothetical protein